MMRSVKIFILIFAAVLLFTSSCFNKKSSDANTTDAVSARQGERRSQPDTKKSTQCIAVLLAYGYNEGVKKDKLLDGLKKEYGFANEGGAILPLIYPDDFTTGGRVRLSSLVEKLQNRPFQECPLAALITLGAPDGTHTVLAMLEEKEINIPVFSVFPQDDILGTEAGSTLVIDYRPAAQSAGNTAVKEGSVLEESSFVYPNDILDVLAPLINASLNWTKLQDGGMLISSLRTEFLKRTLCNLAVYTDPETGLRSKNHYALEGITRETQ